MSSYLFWSITLGKWYSSKLFSTKIVLYFMASTQIKYLTFAFVLFEFKWQIEFICIKMIIFLLAHSGSFINIQQQIKDCEMYETTKWLLWGFKTKIWGNMCYCLPYKQLGWDGDQECIPYGPASLSGVNPLC